MITKENLLLNTINFIESIQNLPNDTRVVLINLEESSTEKALYFEQYLDSNEHARLKNITNKEKRRTFIICRFVAKQLIGDFFGLNPLTVNFQYTERGKPYLPLKDIHLNISHSGDYALIGVSQYPIGVDIEKIKPNRDFKRLAEMVLSEDERAWVFAQDTEQRFYHLWTLKEARLKCDGDGLAGYYPAATFSPETSWRYPGYAVFTQTLESYIYTICIHTKD